MRRYITSDLAYECIDNLREISSGVLLNQFSKNEIEIIDIEVVNEVGEASTGKKIGKYTTLCFNYSDIYSRDQEKNLTQVFADTIGEFILPKVKRILIVGLGNRLISTDMLGPMAIEMITATRHLPKEDKKSKIEISLLLPRTKGQTGFSSFEAINNAVKTAKAEQVIIIDALCTKDLDRLCSTIQISNTGITPGSGSGNNQEEISLKTINVPVIAVGVPTVINSSTLIVSTLKKAGINYIPKSLNKLVNNEKGYFVISNQNDALIRELSRIIAKGIEFAISNKNESLKI